MTKYTTYDLRWALERNDMEGVRDDCNSLGVAVVPPTLVLVGILPTPSPENTGVLARREKVL